MSSLLEEVIANSKRRIEKEKQYLDDAKEAEIKAKSYVKDFQDKYYPILHEQFDGRAVIIPAYYERKTIKISKYNCGIIVDFKGWVFSYYRLMLCYSSFFGHEIICPSPCILGYGTRYGSAESMMDGLVTKYFSKLNWK